MVKKKGNNYIIREAEGIALLELHRRGEENLWTTIDLEDLERVISFPYTWFAKFNHTNSEYYVVASVYHPELKQSRPVFLHQFLMDANGQPVDHKNNKTLDNRKSNLRVTNNADNLRNRKGKNANNTSGYRNVIKDNQSGKWVVQLQIDGKARRFGSFDDVHAAGKYAEELRQKYYGEFPGVS